MGLPELREKVEAEVKCQEHLRKILDSDPKMRAAIIFFAARNFLRFQVKSLGKKKVAARDRRISAIKNLCLRAKEPRSLWLLQRR